MPISVADLRVRARILRRAIRWRSGSAVMLFAVSAVAIAGAAIGPMFVQSSDDSVLASDLAAAPAGSTSLSFVESATSPHAITEVAEAARTGAGKGRLGKAIYTADLGTLFSYSSRQGPQEYSADLLSRSEICAHLRFVHGSCPRHRGEVALSERSAVLAGAKIGSRLALGVAQGTSSAQPVRVSGIYLQPSSVDDAYWGNISYFAYGESPPPLVKLDPLITTAATVEAFATSRSPVQYEATLAWRRGAELAGAGPLEAAARRVRTVAARRFHLSVESGLSSVVASARHDEHLMGTVVLAIVLQLVLLSLLVLYSLGQTTAAARHIEADFARRRGFPRSASLSLAVAEPAVLIALALPAGILLAWATLVLSGSALFVSGTPIGIDGLALAGAFAGLVAALATTTIASYSLWRRPRADGRRTPRGLAGALDAGGVALALAGLLALLTGGSLNGTHANPLAAVAPGLLALGGAVIGLRLISALVGVAVRRTGASPHVAWFLALRQIARRSEVLRRLFPLTVATSVVLFAVASFALASENRARAAEFSTGAARVVDVSLPPGLDLVGAVRKADPSGHQAMAVAVYSSSDENLLAVDATRLAAVASWPSGLSRRSPAVLARLLTPKLAPAVELQGSHLRLSVALPRATPPILVQATIFDEHYDTSETVSFGPLRPGLHDYTANLVGSCTVRCRLVNLAPQWWSSNTSDQATVTIAVRHMAAETATGTWRAVAFGAGRPASWRSQVSALKVATTTPGAPGLVLTVPGADLLSGGDFVAPADLPRRLPMVFTSELARLDAPAKPGGPLSLEGLDGNALVAQSVATVPALPQVGDDAALVDLPLAERAETTTPVETTDEVWLSASASPAVLTRLRHEGVALGAVTLASDRLGSLDHRGLALAYDLALIVSPIAAVLALGSVVFTIAAEGRRRRRDIVALGTAGVPRRLVGRAVLIENALVGLSALVIGGAIGLLADALALSSLPQLSAGAAGLPLATGIPTASFLLALVGLALALALGATVASRLVIRGAFSELGRS